MDPILIIVLIVIGIVIISIIVYGLNYLSAEEIEKECLIVEKNSIQIPGGHPKQYYITVEYDGIKKKLGTYDHIYFALNVDDKKTLKIKGRVLKSIVK